MRDDLDPIPGYRVMDDKGHAVEFGGLEIRNPKDKPSHEDCTGQK